MKSYLGLLRSIGLFVVLHIHSYGQQPFVCNGDFYISQTLSQQNGPTTLFIISVDSITGNIVFDPLPEVNEHGMNAIGYRNSDNFIYGLHPFDHWLYRVDGNGMTTVITKVDKAPRGLQYFAADIAPSGEFMVLLGGNADRDVSLLVINLEDPSYPTDVIPLTLASTGGIPNTRIADIVFDPFTWNIYAVDIIQDRLVKIDLNTGLIRDNIYPPIGIPSTIAALFFDAFGNLFAYGSSEDGGIKHSMFGINKETGEFTFLTEGPSIGGVDGCSCPYNVSFEKIVLPDTTVACTDVTFVFRISNASQGAHQGIEFEDDFPPGFEIVEISYNPYGGKIIEGVGTNHLLIRDMDLKTGIDSILVRVNVGPNEPGKYGNLAYIRNLPNQLGKIRASDNPETLTSGDSTYLVIQNLMAPEISDNIGMCPGETVLLDPGLTGVSYQWQDNATDSFYLVEQPGIYGVTITSGCDSVILEYHIEEKSILVELPEEQIHIALGDSLLIQPNVTNSGTETNFFWNDPLHGTLSCLNCKNPSARPFFDVTYKLKANNEFGCETEAEVRFEVEKNRDFFVPNIFSPNGDGINDYFFIQGKGTVNVLTFEIFDRFGNMVFQSSNGTSNRKEIGWDGRFRNQDSALGVYVWYAVIKYLDGILHQATGNVTLIR